MQFAIYHTMFKAVTCVHLPLAGPLWDGRFIPILHLLCNIWANQQMEGMRFQSKSVHRLCTFPYWILFLSCFQIKINEHEHRDSSFFYTQLQRLSSQEINHLRAESASLGHLQPLILCLIADSLLLTIKYSCLPIYAKYSPMII